MAGLELCGVALQTGPARESRVNMDFEAHDMKFYDLCVKESGLDPWRR